MAKCDHNFLQHHFLKLDLTPLGGARTLNLSMWGTPGSLANQTSLLPKVKVEDATFSLSIGQSNFKWNRTTSIATHSSACERIELSSCSMLTTKVEPSEVFVFRYSIFRLIPAASAGCNRCQPGPGGPPPEGFGKHLNTCNSTVKSGNTCPFFMAKACGKGDRPGKVDALIPWTE